MNCKKDLRVKKTKINKKRPGVQIFLKGRIFLRVQPDWAISCKSSPNIIVKFGHIFKM